MKTAHWFSCLLVLASIFSAGACGESPEASEAPPPESKESAPVVITWPPVTSVLAGTDLVEITEFELAPMSAAAVAGNYSSEQGGAVLSLVIRAQGSALELERQFAEPGAEASTKAYTLPVVTSEGAVSQQGDTYLRQTSDGVLLLEQQSGVETIPGSYWIHYIRQ